jgi:uncharacterized DUF497 family protein
MIEFEWAPSKATMNLRKHGVSFSEAASVFLDPFGVSVADPDHSDDEDRYLIVGLSAAGRMLIVSHTERGDRIRIISARQLTRKERQAYEDEARKRNGR